MKTREILWATTIYFSFVFAAGFALGIVRTLWLLPLLGERAAELAEMPVMLVVILIAARYVTRRFHELGLRDFFIVGIAAFSLVLLLDMTVVLQLRGLSLQEYFVTRDPVAFSAYLAALLVFATLPACLAAWKNR